MEILAQIAVSNNIASNIFDYRAGGAAERVQHYVLSINEDTAMKCRRHKMFTMSTC